MASIGHVAVGLVGARLLARGGAQPREASVLLPALSLAPDLDVIGMRLGVPYGATWGHRGATHSIAVALAVGWLAAYLVRRQRPMRRFAPVALAVLVSHGLLDAMTDGGHGIALLWPWTPERFFFSWRPIPVAPIGLRILSPRGLVLMLREAILFTPAWLVAFWPRRPRRGQGDPPS
jgi:inner membrane protein